MTTKMRSYALLCLVVLGLFVASGAYADRDSPAAAAPSKDVGSLVEPSPANFAARLDEYNQSTNAGTLNSSKFNLEQNRNNYSYIVSGNETSERKDMVDVEDDEGLYSLGFDGTNYLSSAGSNGNNYGTNASGLPASFSGKSGFSINIWVKPTVAFTQNFTGHHFNSFASSFTDNGPLMGWLKSDNVKGWFVGMNKDMQFVYGISVPGSDGIVRITSDVGVAHKDYWYMITATYTPVTGRATLYINGKRTASKKLVFGNQPRGIDYGTSETSLPSLDVMRYSDRSVDVRSKGAIGDIALWDRSLAVSEVRKLALSRRKSASRLYRQISKPSTTELDNSDAPSLFFPFQEGKGSEISDVGPRKMLLHLRGVNPATWIGDLSSKLKRSSRGPLKHQTVQQRMEEERDEVADQMPDRLAKDLDVKARMDEIKQSHDAAIKSHLAENEMEDKVSKAEDRLAHKAEAVQKLSSARDARSELLNRINMHIASKGGNGKIKVGSKLRKARMKAEKALEKTNELYAAAKLNQREARKEKEEVKKAMEEMKFDGSLQAAGYSILHKTVDILGRMLRQRDVTIDMLREQLEAATLEAESESRTAEINRQNDWKECHALDIQAKQHVAKTTQQLHSSRTRSDMAERASSDAHEQRDNNNAHISRLQNYLSHIESQLKRVRTIASVKKVPTATERRAERLMHTMNNVLGEVVEHEAPYDKKIVPKPGQVSDEDHLITSDRDWVDRVDWNTKQNRASLFLETRESNSEAKPWEDVVDETRWGTGKDLVGAKAVEDPLKKVNTTDNAANATDPEYWRDQELDKMLAEKDEKKDVDLCLKCRDEDDHALLSDLFTWPVPEPVIKKPIQDPEFNASEYAKMLDTLEPVGKYDNDKKWLPAKAKAEELHGVIKKLGSMWAGTASMEHPSAYFTFDLAHMQETAKKALDLAKSRHERLELLVSASDASAARASATVNDQIRLLDSQTRFYNNYHIRCEAKADIYAAMADKRSRALDAIASVENLFAEETSASGHGRKIAMVKNETAVERVMEHLEELMRPPKAYKHLAPRPWKHVVKPKKVEPQECSYRVKPGDYMMAIADKFGIEAAALLHENPQAFRNHTMYPKTNTWLAIPSPARNTEGCKMSPQGFAQSVKYMEPLSSHGFPLLGKDASKLSKGEAKLLILARKKNELLSQTNNETAELQRMNQAMEDLTYLTGSNNTGRGDIDRDAMENAISSINNVPSVNSTKKDYVVKLMRKLSAIPTLLEKLSGNMTIDLNDTKSLTEDTVINGKQVLPSALVDDIKRLAEAPSRNISMVFEQKIVFAKELRMYEQKIAEKVLAKYLKVYPDQVTLRLQSNEVFVQGLHQKAAENLRGVLRAFPVQNASNALQAVGLRVTSMLKPCKIRRWEGQVPRLSTTQSMSKLLKHAMGDVMAELKDLSSSFVKLLKRGIELQKTRVAKLENSVNDENKQLKIAEHSVNKKLPPKRKRKSVRPKSKNMRDAIRNAMHLSRQIKLRQERARRKAAEIRARHLKEEAKKAAMKAKALDRQAKKLKLRLLRERRRKIARRNRARQRMARMKKMLQALREKHKKSTAAQRKAAQSKIEKFKKQVLKENREDAKQEANLNLKVLIVDAAEKCELAKERREVMDIAMCKATVNMARRKAAETESRFSLTKEMKKMVKAMPSGDIAVKVRAKPTKVALKSASKAKTIVAKKSSPYKNPGFATFKGSEYVDMGFKGFHTLHLKSSEHLSIETWVKVQNAAADKFAAIVSAIGENKLNPISKQNDGNGPYKRGFVLGFGPSQDDTQTNPVWAFGIKGESGFNPKLSYVRSQSSVKLATWTHLAATYDGKVARLYVNGVVEAVSSTGEQTGKIDFGSAFPTKPKLMLMAYGVNGEVPASPCCVEADLSDTAIWTRTLDSKEVSNHASLFSRTLEAANSAANERDASLVGFWQLSTRAVQMVNDGEVVRDKTHSGMDGSIIEGGGAAAPLNMRPNAKKTPVPLTKEEIESTGSALDRSKVAVDAVEEAKRLLNSQSVTDAQKALLLEAVISGIPTEKLKKITVTEASESVDSKYRSRVISVVGDSNKFPEGRKKTALVALVTAESKADVGNILEALLNGRKITVPGLEKKPAFDNAKSISSSLPKNIHALLKSLKESTEQEVRMKLSGQALKAKKRAKELYNKQKAELERIQKQLNLNIKNVAAAQQTADKKKQRADTEMKHALALAKEAARTHAKVKKHLESKGYSAPSVSFDQEIRKSKAKMAKKDKKTIIDQTKEMAALAAKRATKKALIDAQAHLQSVKSKFENSRSECVNNPKKEHECGEIRDAVTKASNDVLLKQERFNRAEKVLEKYRGQLSKDISEASKQRQIFSKNYEKMSEHLESEIQRLATIATMAKRRHEELLSEGKFEAGRAFERMGEDAEKAAAKAAMELADRKVKFDHYNGKSSLVEDSYDKSTISFDRETHGKWTRDHEVKYADVILAGCVRNTSLAREKVKTLGAKVSSFGAQLADSNLNSQTKEMLRGNLNLASSQYKSAQSELQRRLAEELVARAKLMEISGQFYESQKGKKSSVKEIARLSAELYASRNTALLNQQDKEKAEHIAAEKTNLVSEGIDTIKKLSEGLDKVTEDKSRMEKSIRSLETEIKNSTLQHNERMFVRAAIRVDGTKDSFTQVNSNGTTAEAAFIESIADLVGEKKENVQITDVSDVKVQTTMQRAMGRRRLLGNIRGIMPSSSPAEAKQIEIRFKIFTSNPQSASSNLASKMPLLATDYGFKNSVLLENAVVLTKNADSSPQRSDGDLSKPTPLRLGATGISASK